MQLSWRDIVCCLWLCLATIQAYPVQPLPGNDQYVVNDQEYEVDTSRFAQLLSTHLLFDHLETAFSLLSKNISLHFQDAIQVNVKSPESVDNGSSSVDVEILKGQLRGAVGSYIEDKLPSMWNEHASALDKSSLQGFIEYTVHQFCSNREQTSKQEAEIKEEEKEEEIEPQETELPYASADRPITVPNVCLERNSVSFFALLRQYIATHIRHTLSDMMYDDLPVLFASTRDQVLGILEHFNRHLQIFSGDVELTLVLGEIDHTWLASPSQMNVIMTTVSHWSEAEDDEDNKTTQTDPVQSIRHFTSLARSTI
ncbi:hypothetical protein EC973_002506 [Apophysomyces ossiformis]|uniref:Exocyst complex component Sec8 n=1 Tax=Apophysomyces ossiformis TaxID=679940 RepID=A0A8H7BU52_9FUNG|nr:hypothetical protein EC973_002506 [Apophysomyces ossiformis]